MPIEFDCKACDRHIRVKDELAGKRIKCPECEKILTVPEAEEERPAERVRADKPAPRKAAPSRSRDEDEDDRPRKRRDDDEEEDDRPRKRRDDDEEDDRPARRKKAKKGGGSSLPLVLGIGGGVLGLGLIGFLLWWFLSGPSTLPMTAYVSPDAEGITVVRMADGWKADAVKSLLAKVAQANPRGEDPANAMREHFGVGPDEIERFTMVGHEMNRQVFWYVVETTAPYDQEKVKGKLTGTKEETADGRKYFAGTRPNRFAPPLGKFGPGPGMPMRQEKEGIHFAGPKMFVIGPEEGVKKALATAAKPRVKGQHEETLALLDQKHLLLSSSKLTSVQADQIRMTARFQPAVGALADVTSWRTKISLGSTLDFDLDATFADGAKAQAAKKAVEDGLKLAGGALLFAGLDAKASALADKTLKSVKADVSGSTGTLKLQIDVSPDAVATYQQAFDKLNGGGEKKKENWPPKKGGRGDAAQSSENMKKILIAFHNYESVYGHLPTDIIDARTGRALLSWRVAILPFLEQDELHKQFKLDQAWDSPQNRPLAARMPALFGREGGIPNRTPYLRFTGAGTAFPDNRTKMTVAGIADGASNTIGLVDSTTESDWSAPGDLNFNPAADPRNSLRTVQDSYIIGFLDGSVRMVKPKVSAKTVREAITARGGEPAGTDW